jgi:uncharacterized protein
MNKLVWKALGICVLLCAAGSLALAQAPPPKLQALILTGQNIPSHDWHGTTPVLRKLLEDTGKFEVRVDEEVRGVGPETLAPYDVVIVSYYDGGDAKLRWGERTDNALLNYVRGGKGVVMYHFTLAAFDGWTEFEKMCGGNWRPANGHHSAPHDFTIAIKDADHPITRGMKAKFPVANDELYANLKWQPAGSFHVLATAWDDYSLYKPTKNAPAGGADQPVVGPGRDEPMLWTVNYGNGRVFVTALGHSPVAMTSPAFISTLTRGTEWAATGAVTIPLPAEMK